jgi:D-alanine transaminase
MARTIYVNGRYADYHDALIHAEDRGFLFGDAVYEVCPVIAGRIIDEAPHLDRLERSLDELSIDMPMHRSSLEHVLREVVRRNRVREGMIYLEVSRGVAKRDFIFPSPDTPRTLVAFARHQSLAKGDAQAEKGIAVVTTPDIRWGRVDIKTVQLLAPVLAKEEARAAEAKEAWMVDRDGFVTEGASANAWIVTGDNEIVTRPAVAGILRGVTRTVLIELAAREKLKIVERPFTVAEALAARQAFVTSATTFVMPVTSIDGKSVGNGEPGELTMRLRAMVLAAAKAAATQDGQASSE